MRLILIHHCKQLRNNPRLRGHKAPSRRGRPSARARPAKMADSPFPRPMNPQVEAIQAKLRQIDDYQSKGLLRADEADAQRPALRKKMMELLVPDTRRPGCRARARLGRRGDAGAGGRLHGLPDLRPRGAARTQRADPRAGQDRRGAGRAEPQGAHGAPAPRGVAGARQLRALAPSASAPRRRRLGVRAPVGGAPARARPAPARPPRPSRRCCRGASRSTRGSRARSLRRQRVRHRAHARDPPVCRWRRSAWRSATCRSISTWARAR